MLKVRLAYHQMEELIINRIRRSSPHALEFIAGYLFDIIENGLDSDHISYDIERETFDVSLTSPGGCINFADIIKYHMEILEQRDFIPKITIEKDPAWPCGLKIHEAMGDVSYGITSVGCRDEYPITDDPEPTLSLESLSESENWTRLPGKFSYKDHEVIVFISFNQENDDYRLFGYTFNPGLLVREEKMTTRLEELEEANPGSRILGLRVVYDVDDNLFYIVDSEGARIQKEVFS